MMTATPTHDCELEMTAAPGRPDDLRGQLAEINRLRDACRALHDRQMDALNAERDLLLALIEAKGRI